MASDSTASPTDAQAAAVTADAEQVRQQYAKISEDIRKEFRTNLSQLLEHDIKGFVADAKKALKELNDAQEEGGGGSNPNLASQNFAVDLFGDVLSGVFSGKKLNKRQLANNLAKDVITNFFPDLGGSGARGSQSRSQAASALVQLFTLGQRNL